jgi:hypothetical protein
VIARLERVAQFGAEGTLGLFALEDLRQFWLEPPWRGNARGPNPRLASRIPAGVYRLERHLEGDHAPSWALVGGGVFHQWAPGAERDAIVLHVGNRARDTGGCPLPGLRVGRIGGQIAVLDSAPALSLILDALEAEGDHTIEIRDCFGGWEPSR